MVVVVVAGLCQIIIMLMASRDTKLFTYPYAVFSVVFVSYSSNFSDIKMFYLLLESLKTKFFYI